MASIAVHNTPRRSAVAVALWCLTAACSGDEPVASASSEPDTVALAPIVLADDYPADAAQAMSTMASSALYREALDGPAFTLTGVVQADNAVPGDSLVEPTHDQRVCRPFRDVFMPRRGTSVGSAIVWIAGIEAGKANTLPMRTSVRIDNCRLDPRVHVVAQGGTVLVGSRDAIVSRLRFIDALGRPDEPRALVPLNDFGQVVPNPDIARTAGLIEVRDDRHPWVRGFIAVAPHPYVTVTDVRGTFRFDSVPAGTHELIVFSEALGVLRQVVDVQRDSSIVLRYGALPDSTTSPDSAGR